MKKSSMESEKASKPPAKPETVNFDNLLVNLEPIGSLQDEAKTQTDGDLITMLTKNWLQRQQSFEKW